MQKKTLIGAGILVLSIIVLIAALIVVPQRAAPFPYGERTRDAVAVIYISGSITTGGSGSDLLGSVVAGSDTVTSQIRQAAEDPQVKAVVLRINSPGGSAAGSQEIADEVARLRETGKVVVTSMGDVAASGGYWIASQSDRIMANPGTMTGSIGVITQLQNWEELYDMIGIGHETFTSGPHKDMGSTARSLTDEERQLIQAMVDDIYDQFLEVVASGRGMDIEEVRPVADGRIFTGRQAREAGLVDDLGNFHDAMDLAAQLAGLGPNYQVKEFIRLSPLERLLRSIGLSSLFSLQEIPKGLLYMEPPRIN